MKELIPIYCDNKEIESHIFTINGLQVMLDSDVAMYFGVETKRLNEQMKRNATRFPRDFCFRLTKDETHNVLRPQNATSNNVSSKRRYNPFVYTEHGIIALAGVLKSDVAAKMSVEIVRAFVQMRKFILENEDLFLAIAKLQNRQLEFENETNKRINDILKKIDKIDLPKEVVFYAGQYYNAYEFVSSLINNANQSIILVDPYCDKKAFSYLKNAKHVVGIKIIKSSKSKLAQDEIDMFTLQHEKLMVKTVNNIHDRFLLIDESCYSLGTSLNYLGKSMFSIHKIEDTNVIEAIKRVLNQ